MSKEIVVNAAEHQTRIAIVEDGKLAELYIENPENKRTIGNIYLGRVRKVMPSIQAAFVDIGQEQDAFLHFSDVSDNLPGFLELLSSSNPRVEDVDYDISSGEDSNKRASNLLTRGQHLLLQITKEPISNKGSRITTNLTLAGRFLVLVPLADYVAVSRKITEEKERRRLKALAKSLVPDRFGTIIRTVAEGRDAKSLDTDLKLLMERWRRIEKQLTQNPSPPELIHEDVDMASSIIRDQFSSDYDRILVDSKGLYHSIRSYVQAVAPKMADCVELHEGGVDIFKEAGIQSGADKAFRDRIELPSGGYLYIEQTEAMHVIDVNSGRSGRGMSQEENSLQVDLEAARVIAHQVRLRDLGGIIVVDFIDLRSDKNRKKIYQELKKNFKDDRAVTKILPMSDFGLVEITRQRLRPSITTTFSSSNGASSEEQDYQPQNISQREYEQAAQEYQKEIKRLRAELKRWKEEAEGTDQNDEEVRTLKQEVDRLKRDLDQAISAKAEAQKRARQKAKEQAQAEQEAPKERPAPTSTEAPAAPPEAILNTLEEWLTDYAANGNRRTLTLRVHPFMAAFLNRPVPSYPTRWFMEHMIRVRVEQDESLSPLAYRFVDARSGDQLAEQSFATAEDGS